MNQRFSLLCIALLLLLPLGAQKASVWRAPAWDSVTHGGDGFFHLSLEVDSVELTKAATLVHVTARLRSDAGEAPKFSRTAHLQADGRRYEVLSAEGVALDAPLQTGAEDLCAVVFRFPPLPAGTRSFDFVGGDGPDAIRIAGIRPVEALRGQLFPSYWRDAQTGRWEIAFFADFALYDCRFWQYARRGVDPRSGAGEIVLRSGSDSLRIAVGKWRKGGRSFRIGSRRLNCVPLTGRTLPDYPVADSRTVFSGEAYRPDTVVVAGWLKDMPEALRRRPTLEIGYTPTPLDEPASLATELDSLGRFVIRIPVVGPTECFIDWARSSVRTLIEPGRRYFLLHDYRTGRRCFMGHDARLQNELLRFPPDWQSLEKPDGGDFAAYIASTDSLLSARRAYVDSLSAAHPSLSARYRAFRRGHSLWIQARDFGQSRFRSADGALSPEARRYAAEVFWPELPASLTMHRDILQFLRDFVGDALWASGAGQAWDYRDHLDEVAADARERAVLDSAAAIADEWLPRIEALPTLEDKVRMAEEVNARYAELNRAVARILSSPRVRRLMDEQLFLERLGAQRHLLDSLATPPAVRDMLQARLACEHLDHTRCAFPEAVMDSIRSGIGLPLCLNAVERLNGRYRAIESQTFDRRVLKRADALGALADGRDLLGRMLEPFRGRFVLLDVWGTWCAPCKEALSHSAELYARLAPYGVAYLYLANQSPTDSWENVIKEYGVSGEHVAHYNLPEAQQAAVERYLGVAHFPTYRLFDREGNLLNFKVDVRDLDSLEALLRHLSGR